jgi:MFS family permease
LLPRTDKSRNDLSLIIRGFRVAIAKVNTENSRALPITPTPAAERQRLSPILTLLLGLMFLSVFINYVDRGNLSIAAPMLKDEFKLSGSQLGILLSSFFWTYAGFQIISGWLVDRFDVKWVMAAGFFLWSGATAVTGVLHGFAILLVARLLLGAGESVAYPSYSKILARDFPEEQRGFANSVIVRLAVVLRSNRPGKFAVALALAQVNAARRAHDRQPVGANAGARRNFAAALGVGDVRRALLHQLSLLLFAYMVALLSGPRTAFLHG